MPEKLKVLERENQELRQASEILRKASKREGFDVAGCTVQRLMREMGLEGAIRGKPVRTTVSDRPCPLDQVNRQFHAPAPNRLWVSDLSYVATWTASSTSPSSSTSMPAASSAGGRAEHAGFALEALEQALHERRPVRAGGDPPQRQREAIRVDQIH